LRLGSSSLWGTLSWCLLTRASMASASQWRNGRDAGKGKAKGKGKGSGEDWQWAMMCEMMAFMAKGKGKGTPGQPGSKKNKGKPKEPKEGKEQQLPKDALSDADLETLKDQVLQFWKKRAVTTNSAT